MKYINTRLKESIQKRYLCTMFLKRIYVLVLPAILLLATSCSEYSKILKSSDLRLKYEKAVEYYDEGEYLKAYPLLEELIAVYRGTEKSEKLNYILAYCDYKVGDYVMSAYRFKQFTKNFPTSKYVEECLFMSGVSHYKNSPMSSLDQTDTYNAMRELQLFINQYPTSSRLDTSNILMDNLRFKLEKKQYDIAYQYYHTRSYKAAIISFATLITNYPDTEFRENAGFYTFASNYRLAIKSIESKKQQRIEDTVKAYIKFVDSFPESKLLKEAENMYKTIIKEKEKQLTDNS
jgi:outer membrane protein assembly factor BamD